MSEQIWPRIELKMVGDWGVANFHTLVGMIAANMRFRSAPRSRFWILTGTGYRDNIEAVARGEVDLGITTPLDVPLEWAREGKHMFAGRPYPFLRTLGYYPQDDRLVFAVREDTGLTSFADIRERKYPLRLATSLVDEENFQTYVIDRALEAHGIAPDDFEKWGGKRLGSERPQSCLAQAVSGEADAAFFEGIMTPGWYEWVEKTKVRFIPFARDALASLQRDYGLRPATLAKGRLKAPEDIPCLDFSHWAVVVRDDMDEEVAYRITAVLVEHRGEMEARFRHIPVERSPMTYPVDPYAMSKGLGAPLHPGAERYYREHGYMA
jgi:TRAP transporter TAXI family solute receptor